MFVEYIYCKCVYVLNTVIVNICLEYNDCKLLLFVSDCLFYTVFRKYFVDICITLAVLY